MIRNIQLDILAKEQTIINLLKSISEDLKELNDKLDIETFICKECGEVKLIEDLGNSELAKQDMICKECMGDGYGLWCI
mgnify:CR=1 FL=1